MMADKCGEHYALECKQEPMPCMQHDPPGQCYLNAVWVTQKENMPQARERACTTYVLRSQPWLTTLAAGIPANSPAWWSAKQRRYTAWSKPMHAALRATLVNAS